MTPAVVCLILQPLTSNRRCAVNHTKQTRPGRLVVSYLLPFLLIAAVVMVGCGPATPVSQVNQPSPQPTNTAEPSATSRPTDIPQATANPRPTKTPEPTDTASPAVLMETPVLTLVATSAQETVIADGTPTISNVMLSPEEEQQLYADIFEIYEPYGGANSETAQDIVKNLEKAKKLDPNKFPENLDQYNYYVSTVGWLVGVYYASGDNPDNRNQKILEVLAQIRELARPNPFFEEKHWEVEK